MCSSDLSFLSKDGGSSEDETDGKKDLENHLGDCEMLCKYSISPGSFLDIQFLLNVVKRDTKTWTTQFWY